MIKELKDSKAPGTDKMTLLLIKIGGEEITQHLNRIKGELDENLPREQAGFKSGYSTVDHLHSINQLIEKANEYNLKLCIGYIDYEKAFDSVEHRDLFTALR
ncbi:uncharacterized protein [Amphiura filiformis]|uniref:uncharacterized protein n=1 Tax=Amphiura filiformis TaxID=82378 RepID=UPI003B2266CD